MNKRERVLAAVAGKPVDRVPSGFWLHFIQDKHFGTPAVDAHMDFYEKTNTDICKIMNEYLFPEDPLLKSIQGSSKIKPISKNSEFLQKQIELIKRIVDKVNGEAVVLSTIHGVVASFSHMAGGAELYDSNKQVLVQYLRENPKGMVNTFEVISEALEYLAEESLKAGADGIYYAALGGEKSCMYSDDEFSEYIKPYDLRVINAAKNRECFNVLHMCKNGLNLNRYVDYNCEVVNWGVYENNMSLLEGSRLFPNKVILGGLDDRAGVLVDGTIQQIENAVYDVLDTYGTNKFILGADCTLPTDIDYKRIHAAVEAAGKYKK